MERTGRESAGRCEGRCGERASRYVREARRTAQVDGIDGIVSLGSGVQILADFHLPVLYPDWLTDYYDEMVSNSSGT